MSEADKKELEKLLWKYHIAQDYPTTKEKKQDKFEKIVEFIDNIKKR